MVYFTGCVAAFFPMAQQIPIALAEILQASNVDFTLLGEEEWCCGFPLLGAGMVEEAGGHHRAQHPGRKGQGRQRGGLRLSLLLPDVARAL